MTDKALVNLVDALTKINTYFEQGAAIGLKPYYAPGLEGIGKAIFELVGLTQEDFARDPDLYDELTDSIIGIKTIEDANRFKIRLMQLKRLVHEV